MALCTEDASGNIKTITSLIAINKWKERTLSDITSNVPLEKIDDYKMILKENIDIECDRFKDVSNLIDQLVECSEESSDRKISVEMGDTSLNGHICCKKEKNGTFSFYYVIHILFHCTTIDPVDTEEGLDVAHEAFEKLEVSVNECVPTKGNDENQDEAKVSLEDIKDYQDMVVKKSFGELFVNEGHLAIDIKVAEEGREASYSLVRDWITWMLHNIQRFIPNFK